MKNKLLVWLVVSVFMSLNVMSVAYAQTSVPGPSGPASATVGSTLEFSLKKVVKMSVAAGDSDPFTQGTDVSASPSFAFGTLSAQKDAGGVFQYMKGEFFYYVLMIAATSGRRYKITETGTQLTGTGSALGKSLPREAVLLVPDYQWLDQLGGVAQGAPPGTATVGPATTACSATDSLVYQSDNGGLGRLVRAVIAISGPSSGTLPFNYSGGFNGPTGQGTKQEYAAWTPINQNQTAGPYSGTVTFTLTLN